MNAKQIEAREKQLQSYLRINPRLNLEFQAAMSRLFREHRIEVTTDVLSRLTLAVDRDNIPREVGPAYLAPELDLTSAPTSGLAAAPTSGLAAAPTSGLAAAPTSGLAAAPTSGLAAAPTSGLAAAPTSGLASAPASGLAAAPTSGLASAPASVAVGQD